LLDEARVEAGLRDGFDGYDLVVKEVASLVNCTEGAATDFAFESVIADLFHYRRHRVGEGMGDMVD
jgi:hypothetical protein